MKITSIVARYLLGLMFTVFGLNGFLNFIHQPPPANPLAITVFCRHRQHRTLPRSSSRCRCLVGCCCSSGYFVPLALTLLAAELYNILAFHLTMCTGAASRRRWSLACCGFWSSCSTAKASRASSARRLRRRHKLRRSKPLSVPARLVPRSHAPSHVRISTEPDFRRLDPCYR